ncbi:MAG: hypothetical protein GY842_22135 [bacterium]|nr:hypothetical protein [bacterium]
MKPERTQACPSDGAARNSPHPRRRARRWLGVLCIIVVAGAICVGGWTLLPERRTYYTDADTIKVPADTAPVRDILWQPPTMLGETINSPNDDYEPRLSADGMTLYLVRGKPGHNADIHVSNRTPNGWTEPRPLETVNTSYDDLGPDPSPNGLLLYFYSDRPGGSGGYDLWMARRDKPTGTFAEPINLGPRINSPYNDYGPAVTPDHRTLYFASNRPHPDDVHTPDPQAWPATVREDLYQRDYDLYTAPITESGLGAAAPVSSLNSPANEGTPALSPAGDFVYFSSDRPGGAGGFDLYRSRRRSEAHGPAEHLGLTVNSPAHELDPALSMAGYELHFSSNRADRGSGDDAQRAYDVYHTTSREVFAEVETQHARIDWAAIWSAIGPNLLWAILALLLLLLLSRMLSAAARRKLSLLARCALASLFIHALLMLIFSVWEVTASLAGLTRQRGGVQVALAAPSAGQGLSGQIRGGYASFTAPLAPASVDRQDAATPQQPRPRNFETTAKLAQIDSNQIQPPPAAVNDAPSQTASPQRTDAPILPSSPRTASDPLSLGIPSPTEGAHDAETEMTLPQASEPSPERNRLSPPAAAPPAPALNALQAPAPVKIETTPLSTGFAAAPTAESAIDTSPPLRQAAQLTLSTPAVEPYNTLALGTPEVTPLERTASPERPAEDFAAIPHPLTPIRPVVIADHSATEVALDLPLSAAPRDPLDTRMPLSAPVIRASKPPERPTDTSPTPLPHSAPAPVLNLAAPDSEAAQPSDPVDEPAAHAPLAERPSAAKLTTIPPILAPATLPNLPPNRTPLVVPLHTPPIALPDAEASTARVTSITPRLEPTTALRLTTSPMPDLLLPAEEDSATAGVVFGRVTDAGTGEPLPQAVVHLDLADGAGVIANADEAGTYELSLPEVPDFFALSASHEGFLPDSANVAAAAVVGRALRVDFKLRPARPTRVAIEAVPDVHHLGDDRFEGRVNSQFQKRAEGAKFSATFDLEERQVSPGYTSAQISVMAKGVQMRHLIYLNGRRLKPRLGRSPRDGSFGEWRASFDPGLLQAGTNTLEIRARSRGDDVDDFEFVNLQLHLSSEQGEGETAIY